MTPDSAGTFQSVEKGINSIANEQVRTDLSGKLRAGKFSTFRNVISNADAVTIGDRIYVSQNLLSGSPHLRGFTFSHEFFHVLENRLLTSTGFFVANRPPDVYADFFAARVAPEFGWAYLGDPGVFFRSIVAGRYDPQVRHLFGAGALP